MRAATLGAWPVLVLGLLISAIGANAVAQETPGRSVPRPGTEGQRQDIRDQLRGQYPAFQRSPLPAGAINKQWAEQCGTGSSTVYLNYVPGEELRVRARQLVGTVMVFPEPVSVIVSGLGSLLTLQSYPNRDAKRSTIWVIGVGKPGADGNLAFVGGVGVNGPRIYSLRVQTEGFNSKNCPDLLVYIRDGVDAGVAQLAERVARGLPPAPPAAPPSVPVAPVESAPLDEPQYGEAAPLAEDDTTGRNPIDWAESVAFDPTKISFDWTVRGEKELAPDIVYSDQHFTYLYYDKARMDRMVIPSISVIENTDRGKLDAPVEWVRRDNVIVVHRVAALTLEKEGLVTCIEPAGTEKAEQ